MEKIRRAVFITVFALGACAAAAQSYPAKPVRVIVSFPPGAGVDTGNRWKQATTTRLHRYTGVPGSAGWTLQLAGPRGIQGPTGPMGGLALAQVQAAAISF